MNVLMIDQWLPNQTYALELARPLSKLVSLSIMTNKYYHPEKEDFLCKSVLESKVKEQRWGFLSYFRGLVSLYTSVLFGKYDIIHIQAFKQQRFEIPAFILAHKFTHKKIVYTAHNILPHENSDGKSTEELKRWYQSCDAIIVHNNYSKKVLVDFEPSVSDIVHVVPHGTYTQFAALSAETAAHNKVEFLQFGMIRKYKGIDTLLKAASLLPDCYRKKIHIVIAGNQRKDLDDTDYQALLDTYNINDFVTFSPNRIPDELVPDYFNHADCCLFPYKEIYGSGALLMAYSFEKPVLASAIPTFVEETDEGKTGILYDPAKENSLTEAIQQFVDLSESDKAELKQNIKNVCTTKYSWSVSASKLAEIYKSVLK